MNDAELFDVEVPKNKFQIFGDDEKVFLNNALSSVIMSMNNETCILRSLVRDKCANSSFKNWNPFLILAWNSIGLPSKP